jgi:hypothetical protein
VVASENSNPEGVPGTNGVKVILREGLSSEGPRTIRPRMFTEGFADNALGAVGD